MKIKILEKIKDFVTNLAFDKKDHNNFGDVINPVIILVFLVLFTVFFKDPFLGIYVGCVVSCAFHYSIEVYQKVTNTGKYEIYDALAGSYSALVVTIITIALQISLQTLKII